MKRFLQFCILSLVFVSCKHTSDERHIEYVTPVVDHNTPVDSLIMELEELMQQYAAILSRSEQGEDMGTHFRAIQSRILDFGFKMEMMMHDMSEEDRDRFTEYYDDCIKRMGMGADVDDPNIGVVLDDTLFIP